MPRTKRGSEKRSLIRIPRRRLKSNSLLPDRVSGRRRKNRPTGAGKESSGTTKSTKRKSTTADPPRQKHQRVATIREPESDSSTSEDDEEFDDNPLTKANIPKIVEAVISNRKVRTLRRRAKIIPT